MLRLFKLEFKKILKRRQTKIVILLAFILTLFMAITPVLYQEAYYTNISGEEIKLIGLDAIKYKDSLKKEFYGDVTPNKLRFAVNSIQETLKEFGETDPYSLPLENLISTYVPVSTLITFAQTLLTNPATGYFLPVADINTNEISDDLTLQWKDRVNSLVQNSKKSAALNVYSKVVLPFKYYGSNGDALDYQTMLSVFIIILSVIIAAPIFSSDYTSGAETILCSTKNGGKNLAIVKVLSVILISTMIYIISTLIYIIISNSFFGWEVLKTSMQIEAYALSLGNLNIGQLQLGIFIAGILSSISTVSLTILLSSKNKNVIVPLVIGLMVTFLPVFLYGLISSLPDQLSIWIQLLIPSSGGNIVGNFFNSTMDYSFFNIGNILVWTPYALVIFSVIEVVIFNALTVFTYNKFKEFN